MEKFKPIFSMPYFLMEFKKKSEQPEKIYRENTTEIITETDTHRFRICHADILPCPVKWDNLNFFAVVLGSPIVDGKIDKKKAPELITNGGEINKKIISNINGEFLIFIIDKKSSKLTIINDRFASFPLYYCSDESNETFYASTFFTHIWNLLKTKSELDLNQNAFFEFIWFQRMLGNKTLLNNVLYLADASVLESQNGKTEITRYWQRDYQKSQLPFRKHAEKMAELVRQSIKRKTSDHQRYGLFLSGGMDSRSVLAAFNDSFPVCFTAAISENREFRTARKIAHTKGAEHIGLELHPEHFGEILNHSVQVCGGMYNYDNGLFYGFNDIVKKYANVCFHGHGFDYMFQGMYIPGKSWKLAGRTLYLRTIIDLPDDLTNYFINNASYRTKKADIWKYVLPEHQSDLQEFQHNSVSEILNYGRTLSKNPYDLFEFLTFHHITRHYSFPNNACVGTFAEQRSLTFDNDLFDFYLSLPEAHRFNGKIEKQCLKILDPQLAAIWSANTNLPVTASCWLQTAYQIAGYIKRKIIPEKEKPEWEERTWTARDHAVRNQQAINNALADVFSSGVLEQLTILNIDKIKDEFTRYVNGENVPGISGDFVQAILTVGTFLKQNGPGKKT